MIRTWHKTTYKSPTSRGFSHEVIFYMLERRSCYQRMMKQTEDHFRRNMSNHFEGKVVLITGASRGLGATTARLFAQERANVVLASRNEEELTRLAEEIKASGGEAIAVQTDVSNASSVEALVQRTTDTYGRLDVAVNNAGIGGGNKPFVEVTEELFDQVIATNLKGIFLSMKYEIPALLAGGGGAIVNVSSTMGLVGLGGIAPYIASKHGIVGLTKAAALEYAGQHLRVNALAPGTTRTSVNERWLDTEQIGTHSRSDRSGSSHSLALLRCGVLYHGRDPAR
jgi:A-factor type gamma-butyrolactone 1'-reductase (1S-forming)